MPIDLRLDMMLVRRKIKSNELARAVGITAPLSFLWP